MDRVVELAIRRAAGLSSETPLTDGMALTDDLAVDSFALMAILVAIEGDYGFEFRPESVLSFKTIKDVQDETDRLRGAQGDGHPDDG